MKLREFLNEAMTMTLDDAQKQIEKNYKKIFPKGYFNIKDAALNSGADGKHTFHVTTGLIGDNVSHVSLMNDPAHHSWMIIQENDVIQIWSVEGSIRTKQEPGSVPSRARIKTSLRKAKNLTLPKLVLRLKKDFEKIKKIIDENKDSINGNPDKKYLP